MSFAVIDVVNGWMNDHCVDEHLVVYECSVDY